MKTVSRHTDTHIFPFKFNTLMQVNYIESVSTRTHKHTLTLTHTHTHVPEVLNDRCEFFL